jgi:hypothetical protein
MDSKSRALWQVAFPDGRVFGNSGQSTPHRDLNGMADGHVRHLRRTPLGEVERVAGAQHVQADVVHGQSPLRPGLGDV